MPKISVTITEILSEPANHSTKMAREFRYPIALRTKSASRLPIVAMPISTAIRMLQLNGKRVRRKSVGAIAEIVIALIELMIDEKRNEMLISSSAFRHGVCSVRPLKAKPTVNAAAALIAAMRAQNLRLQIMSI